MQSNESPTPYSPFHPRNLFDLFFRPTLFFERFSTFEHFPEVYLSAWLYGIALVFPQLISQVPRVSGTEIAWVPFANSGIFFWLFSMIGGAIGALILWFGDAWLYWLRAKWSSVSEPDGFLVRQIYFYSALIAVPTILVHLFYTVFFSDYATDKPSQYPMSYLLIFAGLYCWSTIVSYKGLQVYFKEKKWAVRIWFLLLPLALQIFSFAVKFI